MAHTELEPAHKLYWEMQGREQGDFKPWTRLGNQNSHSRENGGGQEEIDETTNLPSLVTQIEQNSRSPLQKGAMTCQEQGRDRENSNQGALVLLPARTWCYSLHHSVGALASRV